MFGITDSFWKGPHYEIGLPNNATMPYGWRRAAYEHARSIAPSQAHRDKLLRDNAYWYVRDLPCEIAENM